jgi:hypothetical protein
MAKTDLFQSGAPNASINIGRRYVWTHMRKVIVMPKEEIRILPLFWWYVSRRLAN